MLAQFSMWRLRVLSYGALPLLERYVVLFIWEQWHFLRLSSSFASVLQPLAAIKALASKQKQQQKRAIAL